MDDHAGLLIALDDAEKSLAYLREETGRVCQNTHQAYQDLDRAQEAFETGFWRLRRALEAPDTPWKVRHGAG